MNMKKKIVAILLMLAIAAPSSSSFVSKAENLETDGTSAAVTESCLNFVGTNAALVQMDQAVSQIPETVEMWVKIDSDSTANHHALISAYSATTQNPSAVGDWNLDVTGGKIRWVDHTSKGTSGQLKSTNDMPMDEWVHVAVTRTDGAVTFYMNGEEAGTATYSGKYEDLTTSTTTPVLGYSIFDTHTGNKNFLDGSMKDVRLWSDVRTADEIKGNMNASLTGSEEGLMNYWKLDEEEGTVFEDSVAEGGIDGTIQAVSLEKENGLEFKGVNTALVKLDSAVGQIPNTVELWVWVDDTSEASHHALLGAYDATTQVGSIGAWNFDIYEGKLRWVDMSSKGASGQLKGTTDIPKNEWTHVAVARGDGKVIFYVNGEQAGTVEYSNYEENVVSNVIPTLGYSMFHNWTHSSLSNYLDGKMKDVRLWSDARTEDEIKGNMNMTLNGDEEGLMNYWKLDEQDGVVIKDSVKTEKIDGTIRKKVSFGKENGLEFAGTNATLVQMDQAVSQIPETVEMWVKIDSDSIAKHDALISAYSAATQAPSAVGDWNLDVTGGKLRWVDHTSKGTSGQLKSTNDMPMDEWVHVAVTRTDGAVTFYMNGEEAGTATYSGKYEDLTTSTTTPVLGYSMFDSGTGNNFLDGSMKDVRLWSDVRTADEIKENMNASLTGSEEGLMNYWKLNEEEGTVFEDSVATDGISAKLLDNESDTAWLAEPMIEFPGVNKALAKLDSAVGQIPNTVEMWVWVDDTSQASHHALIGAYDAETQEGSVGAWNFDIYEGKLRWVDMSTKGRSGQLKGTTDIPKNEWTHVAVARGDGKVIFYVNGEQAGTVEYSTYEENVVSNVVPILGYSMFHNWASDNLSNYLDGKMKDVRLWSHARTADEIKGNMNASLTGSEEGLMNYWKMDETDGVVFKDSTISGNYGMPTVYWDSQQIDNKFIGMNLDLNGRIGFNVYVDNNNSLSDDAYVEFTLPKGNTTQKVLKSAATTTINGLKFTCLVPAKEMTDKITVCLYNGGKMLDTKSVSVQDYAEIVISQQDANADYKKAANLITSMLDYGAAAQKYFKYNTETLANKNYSAGDETIQQVDASTIEAKFKDTESALAVGYQGLEGVGQLARASLILESETTLRMFFKFENTPTNIEFSSNGNTVDYTVQGNYYVVDIENIAAKDLDTNYTVTVIADEQTFTATCSAMAFCYKALCLTDTQYSALQDVTKALYLYNVQANEYFK